MGGGGVGTAGTGLPVWLSPAVGWTGRNQQGTGEVTGAIPVTCNESGTR